MILAIDLSLTATGWATDKAYGLITTDPTADMLDRWETIMSSLTRTVDANAGQADVWIEQGFGMSTRGRSGGDIAELRGALRWELWGLYGITRITEVPPLTLKKFTTGYGSSTKADMIAAVEAWGYDLPHAGATAKSKKSDDVADAVALWQFARAVRTGISHGDTAHARAWALGHSLGVADEVAA